MIVCGFAGIGKTTLAKNIAGWIDLESTPFDKNWETYADVAIHLNNNGFNVMLSCHKEIRQLLLNRGIDFITVLPLESDKQVFIERYKQRGNTEAFINLLNNSWDEFIKSLKNEKFVRTNKYLQDYMELRL